MNTLKDLLDIAIQGEINSQKLYQRGADVTSNKEIKKFFLQLVQEETSHENMLYSIRETKLYDLNIEVNNPDIFEAAKNSHGPDVAFDESWNAEQILDTAMKREFTAMNRYKAAADAAKEDELVNLFTNLSEEEASHHKRVQKEYNKAKGISEKEF